MPSKLCLYSEWAVRSFTEKRMSSGHKHSSDWLVVDWESASSTICFQPVWTLCAFGQHVVNFSHLVGVSVSAKQLKDIVCVSLEGEPGPCPKATLLFVDRSFLVFATSCFLSC